MRSFDNLRPKCKIIATNHTMSTSLITKMLQDDGYEHRDRSAGFTRSQFPSGALWEQNMINDCFQVIIITASLIFQIRVEKFTNDQESSFY